MLLGYPARLVQFKVNHKKIYYFLQSNHKNQEVEGQGYHPWQEHDLVKLNQLC